MSKLPVIDIQKHQLTLPSTKEMVEYRPYFVKEEKQLLIALESEESYTVLRTIRDVCEACSFKQLNPNLHTEFDLEYLFVMLRAKSVGENTNIRVPCQHCSEPNENSIDLTQVTVPDLDQKEHQIQLTDTIHIVMKHPTINELLEFGKIQEAKTTSEIDYMFEKIALYVDQIHHADGIFYAADGTRAEITTFIEELPSAMFQVINTFFNALPRVQYNLNFQCKSCSENNDILITGYQNFFV